MKFMKLEKSLNILSIGLSEFEILNLYFGESSEFVKAVFSCIQLVQ